MKIAVDALPLMLPKTGVGFYTYYLLSQFERIAPDNDYYLCDILLGESFYNLMQVKNLPRMTQTLHRISTFPSFLATLSRIGLFLRGAIMGSNRNVERMDLFFGPNFRGIFNKAVKTVIAIHDMAHEYYPENVEEKLLNQLRRNLPRAARLASLIIADSQNTKKDILKFLGVPDEKVRVIYPGVDETFQPVKDPRMMETVRKKYTLPQKFILYVGTLQPRKNIMGLIRAYGILSKDRDLRHGLVIAGGVGWKSNKIHSLVDELGLQDKIRFPGYVASCDLPFLYNLAEAFVFPSFYEGFGLPVLEAMACGIPVVTSNISSLPEVVGDAAILVNIHSPDEIAEGIHRILRDQDLRAECIAKGLERAKSFTWGKCAMECLKTFNEV